MPSLARDPVRELLGIQQAHTLLGIDGWSMPGDVQVTLKGTDGSVAEIYPFGGVVTSWVKDGRDVLYVRPDAKFDKSKPISGGIPHCWPQFGPGESWFDSTPSSPSALCRGQYPPVLARPAPCSALVPPSCRVQAQPHPALVTLFQHACESGSKWSARVGSCS